MLHSRRRRLAALAEREAAGEDLWTDHFESSFRVRLLHMCQEVSATMGGHGPWFVAARQQILREEGLHSLSHPGREAVNDFIYYLDRAAPDDMMPTVVEALDVAAGRIASSNPAFATYVRRNFRTAVPVLLREHRIAFDFIEGQMVEMKSQELHAEVVAPALTLLANRSGFEDTEATYRKALEELQRGDAADAITDAGTALQNALTAVGMSGNALGDLIKDARKKDLLAPHDTQLSDGLTKVMHWVSADRSELGDAHKNSSASLDDAWLTVHIVGALILRIAGGGTRSA